MSGVASPTHDVKDSQTRYDRYLRLLGDYFSKPRHAFNDEANWLRARRAIIEEFQAIAARVNKVKMEVQKFNSEVVVNGNVPAPVPHFLSTARGIFKNSHVIVCFELN